MRVIFVDIDGCLNSVSSAIYNNRRHLLGFTETPTFGSLCPIACSNLQYAIEECSDVKLVISSSKRKYESLDEFKDLFDKNGIPSNKIIGVTPVHESGYRGKEIQMYLKAHPEVTKFAILDDDSDMKPYMNRLVKTESRNGLTFTDTEKLIEMLGGPNEE